LQRSVGIAKPGRKGTTDYIAFGPFGRVIALAQGSNFQVLLAARKDPRLGASWEPFLDRLSRAITDLAAKAARDTGEDVPLPDPLADQGNPA